MPSVDDINPRGLVPNRTLVDEYEEFIDLLFEIPTNYNLYSRELQQIKDYRDSFYERIPDINKTQSKFASIAFEDYELF